MKKFLDRNEVIPVLQGFNPWWIAKPFVVPQFKRLAFSACCAYLDNITLRRAILLIGPRRVGKTTLLQQLAVYLVQKNHNPKSIFYLSLDHPLLKLLSLRDILAIYHEHIHPEGQPTTLLLDEIQYSQAFH